MFRICEGTVFTDGILDLEVVQNYDGTSEESTVPCYRCRLRLAGTDTRIGTISLRLNMDGNKELYYDGNIGYFIRNDFRGNGYAVRGCKLAALIAKEEEIEEIIICSDVENNSSINVIKELGVDIIDTIVVPEEYQDEHDITGKRLRGIWRIT